MKIAFIKPNMIAGTPCDSMEPLVFAILSALTPPQFKRCLYDERLEPIPFDAPVDLVAITADVFTARRAYQIARRYRQQGTTVVMGGIHPTLCPEEAGQYADSIVIGDAEDTWPRLLHDAEQGTLKPRYVSAFASFGEQPPDRSLFQGRSYTPVRFVEFNRGCRFDCDFCSVRAMYQGKIRRQSLAHVLRDIDLLNRRHLFFTDDNFHADHAAMKALLQELVRRRLRWSCQISADISRHPELVTAMAKAGCVSVTIGFESLEPKNLKQMHKAWMEEDYTRVIRLFQDNGILVYGTFIIGYDHDTPEVFERTLSFAVENRLFLANFNPLIPTPATPLYARLQKEGRLLLDRWWLNPNYRWGDCVFKPLRMTPAELTAGCFRLRQQFTRVRNSVARFPGVSLRMSTLYKAGLFILANSVSHRELKRKYGKALGDPSSGEDLDLQTEDETTCTSH
jgi:radical SAM superfamily enzyme YgiQ (UPF0313 family)